MKRFFVLFLKTGFCVGLYSGVIGFCGVLVLMVACFAFCMKVLECVFRYHGIIQWLKGIVGRFMGCFRWPKGSGVLWGFIVALRWLFQR